MSSDIKNVKTERIMVSSAAFVGSREHKEGNTWIECIVIDWNSIGQPLVIRCDNSIGIPVYIWPLNLIKDFEKTKGYAIRQRNKGRKI